MQTIFEYCYRDAGNFKAFGSVELEGALSPSQAEAIQSKLEAGQFFIAEQVGLPPLYEQLYKWSGGPIGTDHCWRECVGFKMAPTAGPLREQAVTVAKFVERFASLVEWDESLSPHFDMTGVVPIQS